VFYIKGQRCDYDVQYSIDGTVWVTACSITGATSGTDACASDLPSTAVSYLRIHKPPQRLCWRDAWFRLTGVKIFGREAQESDPTEAPPTETPPTESPTEPPTESPTKAPTKLPTEPPTKLPTQAPTEPPTESPTKPSTEPPSTSCTKPRSLPANCAPCLESIQCTDGICDPIMKKCVLSRGQVCPGLVAACDPPCSSADCSSCGEGYPTKWQNPTCGGRDR